MKTFPYFPLCFSSALRGFFYVASLPGRRLRALHRCPNDDCPPSRFPPIVVGASYPFFPACEAKTQAPDQTIPSSHREFHILQPATQNIESRCSFFSANCPFCPSLPMYPPTARSGLLKCLFLQIFLFYPRVSILQEYQSVSGRRRLLFFC